VNISFEEHLSWPVDTLHAVLSEDNRDLGIIVSKIFFWIYNSSKGGGQYPVPQNIHVHVLRSALIIYELITIISSFDPVNSTDGCIDQRTYSRGCSEQK
jgi:hypothetical protein